MPEISGMQEIQAIVISLREQIVQLRSDVKSATSLASAAQAQIASHIAVCDERQRLSVVRQTERDRWHQEQAQGVRQFMEDSATDRQRIRESIIATGATARDDLRAWALRALGFVASANLIGAISIIFTLLHFNAGRP